MVNQAMVIAARSSVAGFPWGCACGECYATERAAWLCRKCRQYLFEEDFLNRKVEFLSAEEASKILQNS